MVMQRLEPVDDLNSGGGTLSGEAIVTTTKKSFWKKIIDFFKKLFGIK